MSSTDWMNPERFRRAGRAAQRSAEHLRRASIEVARATESQRRLRAAADRSYRV